ncbi:flagellar assembly protein FliW [Alkalicella caledoniensis]|uniref:Flagellar assembly factor FliW n=1 Tax=Alkalicella caledoniensis TaxID=2731377 RepID=A0A7G9W712_ALKCA|nr:flagellar assembly protein FliW [Alkalicella caledoniensis]QNO14474.1 flagellar assembly protein FliW [Alkalicella caledoniensis]
MELKSARLGTLEINEDKIITFPEGIPGFENLTKYIIIEEPETGGAFHWLQSVEDGDISLLLTRPTLFTDYTIEVEKEILADIGITEENVGETLTVVTLPEDFSKATTNLMAPVILNSETMQGKQVILTESKWSMKHPLFPAEQNQASQGGK